MKGETATQMIRERNQQGVFGRELWMTQRDIDSGTADPVPRGTFWGRLTIDTARLLLWRTIRRFTEGHGWRFRSRSSGG